MQTLIGQLVRAAIKPTASQTRRPRALTRQSSTLSSVTARSSPVFLAPGFVSADIAPSQANWGPAVWDVLNDLTLDGLHDRLSLPTPSTRQARALYAEDISYNLRPIRRADVAMPSLQRQMTCSRDIAVK